ncbi:MAG: hypothetical protein LQ343_002734 [Gyalolechia ehrenbergii]|nr:MAG: hypothetical protein LQ343_002734 [Gyalolechia ehrenbergii]
MANLSQDDLDVIAEHPFNQDLDHLRDPLQQAETDYKPHSLSHPRHHAVANDAVSRLLATLIAHKAALALPSPTGHDHIASNLSTLLAHVRDGHFDYEPYRALSRLVITQAPDADIWAAVFDLLTTLSPTTPPTTIAPSIHAFPILTSSSSSSQQGAEPTRESVQGRCFEGTRTCSPQNGDASFSQCLEEKPWAKRVEEIYKAMKERDGNGRWTEFPQPPRVDAVCDWWLDLQDRFLSTERGLYYTSTSNNNPSTRHIDLFVKPNNAQSSKLVHDWKDVQVVGELKKSTDKTLRQMRSHVSQVFSNQPTRRSLHTFSLAGNEMRTWVHHRSGPYSSTAFNVHQEPERFIRTLAAYVMMDDEELGLDTSIERDEHFVQAVSQLRANYQRVRDRARLVPPAGRPVIDQSVDVVGEVVHHAYWYEDGSSHGQCIRLADIPGTLSGDILRLRRDLPVLDGDHEITGDQIRRLEYAPEPPPVFDDPPEDLAGILDLLPVVDVNPDQHFVKKGRYESEIRNLLKCQGGSCPGVPISPHIIQLLGRSSNGELVFERFEPRYIILAFVRTVDVYRNWILQLISGLQALHSLGIVHRDLRIDNLLFSADCTKVIICDLEERWGNRLAPEISRHPVLEAGWTEKSDIYDLGHVIKGLIYGNAPITNLVEWPVPPPFRGIVEACTREFPDDRPSLAELWVMVDRIQVVQCETEE